MMLIFVLLLGHDNYKVRECAEAICKAQEYEPYLHHVLRESQCPEIRFRAERLLKSLEIERFVNDPEIWYYNWLNNDCKSWLITDYAIIHDISTSSSKRAYLQELYPGDLGSWSRPGKITENDFRSLGLFKRSIRNAKNELP